MRVAESCRPALARKNERTTRRCNLSTTDSYFYLKRLKHGQATLVHACNGHIPLIPLATLPNHFNTSISAMRTASATEGSESPSILLSRTETSHCFFGMYSVYKGPELKSQVVQGHFPNHPTTPTFQTNSSHVHTADDVLSGTAHPKQEHMTCKIGLG